MRLLRSCTSLSALKLPPLKFKSDGSTLAHTQQDVESFLWPIRKRIPQDITPIGSGPYRADHLDLLHIDLINFNVVFMRINHTFRLVHEYKLMYSFYN